MAKREQAATPIEKQQDLTALAVTLAEKKLRDGTASSQLLCHYLKYAGTDNELQTEKLKQEVELLKAKTEALKSQKSLEEKIDAAMSALKIYAGDE